MALPPFVIEKAKTSESSRHKAAEVRAKKGSRRSPFVYNANTNTETVNSSATLKKAQKGRGAVGNPGVPPKPYLSTNNLSRKKIQKRFKSDVPGHAGTSLPLEREYFPLYVLSIDYRKTQITMTRTTG
jgi:hypothetical protein